MNGTRKVSTGLSLLEYKYMKTNNMKRQHLCNVLHHIIWGDYDNKGLLGRGELFYKNNPISRFSEYMNIKFYDEKDVLYIKYKPLASLETIQEPKYKEYPIKDIYFSHYGETEKLAKKIIKDFKLTQII